MQPPGYAWRSVPPACKVDRACAALDGPLLARIGGGSAHMTLHYHGTPITPITALYELRGRCFCVSHAAPQDVRRVHDIGQSVMLDNGAFAMWRSGRPTKWAAYYAWCDRWLDFATTWAIPPDVIGAASQEQDALLNDWPHGKRQAAPVWHMDEPIYRLCRLVDDGWSRVCIGSTAEFAVVLSDLWKRRMDDAWTQLAQTFARTPPIHMLRGMQCAGHRWPFASVDSTDIAQNHRLPQHTPRKMADRWDQVQCPSKFVARTFEQSELIT